MPNPTAIVHDYLIEARNLIAEPQHWVRADNARNSAGKSVDTDDPSAVCFCAIGALVHVNDQRRRRSDYNDQHLPAAFIALENAIYEPDHPRRYYDTASNIIRWNDRVERQHHEVIDAFDDAIAMTRPACPCRIDLPPGAGHALAGCVCPPHCACTNAG